MSNAEEVPAEQPAEQAALITGSTRREASPDGVKLALDVPEIPVSSHASQAPPLSCPFLDLP